MAGRPQFEVVTDELAETGNPPQDSKLEAAARAAFLLALKTLSQRAIASIKDAFTLLSVASVWWLWVSIPDPHNTQLISLSLYAVFILAANIIVRRV